MISKRGISRKGDFRRSSERKVQKKVTFGGLQTGIQRGIQRGECRRSSERSSGGVQRGKFKEEFREESAERPTTPAQHASGAFGPGADWRRHAAWHRRPLILGLGISWSVSANGACWPMLDDRLVDLVWSCQILLSSWLVLGLAFRVCDFLLFFTNSL